MTDQTPEFKIVVLGAGGVGKSALTVQFHQQVFVQEYDPTLEDNYVKRHDVDGKTYKLSILDTAGQDEFSAFREVYYRSGDGFILVCSFGDESSLREIKKFHTDVRRIREGQGHIPMIIAANKHDFSADLKKFGEEAVINLASELDCKYEFTSAKTNYHVDTIFSELVRKIRDYKLQHEPHGKKHKKNKTKKCLIM